MDPGTGFAHATTADATAPAEEDALSGGDTADRRATTASGSLVAPVRASSEGSRPAPVRASSEGSRNALVTGASRGIGAAIARRLAADGFRVWIHYQRSGEAAEALLKQIQQAGGDGRLLPFDVASAAEVESELAPVLEREGPLEVLVNNAGVTRDALAARMRDDDWATVIETDLSGPFRVTRAALRGMLAARRGRIVNIASVAGQLGNPGQANYAAAKAGLVGLTRTLALEYARRNILVNAVAPGFIATDLTRELPREPLLARIPLGRLGTPDEIAGVVGFLCSEDAAYVTGQVIGVSGGLVGAQP